MTVRKGDNDDDGSGAAEAKKWRDAVLSVLKGEQQGARSRSSSSNNEDDKEEGAVIKVKKLRKLVLLSMQLDSEDKDGKKRFKRAVKALEKDGGVVLDADGRVTLKSKKNKKKRESDDDDSSVDAEKKKKKARTDDSGDDEEGNGNDGNGDIIDKTRPCKGNPQGVTRLFAGNLPFAIDEDSLQAFIPGVTHIKWITDKETGRFYGSAFVEMESSRTAADAVAKAGTQLMGRPIKINFAPARPGDVWPPEKKVVTGAEGAKTAANGAGGRTTTGGQAGGKGIQALAEKPEGCVKLFIGNLSYDIDDDGIHKFFASVDAELKAVRWLHHKDTGDFKGCGFVEFWNTEACEKAAALNGKTLLGRPIRIDWSD